MHTVQYVAVLEPNQVSWTKCSHAYKSALWIYSIERNYKDVDGHCMCVHCKDRGNKKYMYRYIDRNNKDVDGGCTVCTVHWI